MNTPSYQTITGRKLETADLTNDERKFLGGVLQNYNTNPTWTEFASRWTASFERSGFPVGSVVYRICQDLEARLGIAQGKVAPPDYRDYLADLIVDRYGSRYRFCKETGIDPGHLSRVFASRSEFSLRSLQNVLQALHAALVIEPEESVERKISPGEASRVLSAVGF